VYRKCHMRQLSTIGDRPVSTQEDLTRKERISAAAGLEMQELSITFATVLTWNNVIDGFANAGPDQFISNVRSRRRTNASISRIDKHRVQIDIWVWPPIIGGQVSHGVRTDMNHEALNSAYQ